MKWLQRYSSPLFVSVFVIGLALILLNRVRHKEVSSGDDDLTGTVMRRDLLQKVTLAGQISPVRRLDVKPPFSGYVKKLFVDVGDKVKAGDPLVTFSQSVEVDEANFPIRAAFSGVVTQNLRAEGEYVLESGDQNLVLRVDDLSKLYVLTEVPELDVAKLKVRQEVIAKISALGDQIYPAEIETINLSARDKDRWGSASANYQVRVILKKIDLRMYPGMSAILDVVTDRRDAVLTLNQEYVQKDESGYFVVLASGARQSIKVGLQTEEAVEIVSGLKENQKVKLIDFYNYSVEKSSR